MGFYDGADGGLGGEGEELDEVQGEREGPEEDDVGEADWDAQIERLRDCARLDLGEKRRACTSNLGTEIRQLDIAMGTDSTAIIPAFFNLRAPVL